MPLTKGLSRKQRVMEAIRRRFRDYGGPPSQTELARATGIPRNAAGTVLRHLAADGLIRLQIGVTRGIALIDRSDMLSDSELEMAVLARGGRIVWPPAPVAPLATALRVDTGTDCGLPFSSLLAQIDAADMREGDDGGTGNGTGAEDPRS